MAKETAIARESSAKPLNAVRSSARSVLRFINNAKTPQQVDNWVKFTQDSFSRGEVPYRIAKVISDYGERKKRRM